MKITFPRRLIGLIGIVALLLSVPVVPVQAETTPLSRYARDTWASFTAMVDPGTGLPTDKLRTDGARMPQTSVTDIGAYLWSTVAAERLRIIGHTEAVARLSKTVGTLERMERHRPSGQFYDWYDPTTAAKRTSWADSGTPYTPWLSSVDNGWLATGLRIVRNAVPELGGRAGALYDSMDFGFYYRPDVNRILFNYEPDTGKAPCCYDTVVSESRIADYIGITKGELPPKVYYGSWRSFPGTCDWSWQETRPLGVTRRYLGVDVYEGAYPYAGMRVTPSWGGSMFEALMPALFVPEERWAPGSWGVNHPVTVDAQIHHGLREAGYGYWGFSPADVPEVAPGSAWGGYAAYGVDGIGMQSDGYPSDEGGTLVDAGFAGCPGRTAKPAPPPSAYTGGVVTPHAAFLALRFRPAEALADLRKLARDFPIYTKWGFLDSVNAGTGAVSPYYLSLDQGMIMAALGNALGGDVLRTAFTGHDMERALRPVIGPERFGARPRSS